MSVNWKKSVLPHILAVLIFIVLGFIYCSPVLQGNTLHQSDMTQVQGMMKEARDFYDRTGERPLWTNSMFSGMPSFVIYTGPTANQLGWVNRLTTLFLPQPVNMLFIAMLGIYFLLCVLGFNYWVRIFGAVAYGFSSYNLILMVTGHITKMMCMAWMAPVFAGIILVYRGRHLLGGAITALSAGLLIYNNHLQVIYYTLIMIGCLVVGELVYSIKEKTLPRFLIASVVLLIAGILAVLPASDNLLITQEYAKYSIRGSQSELTLQNTTNQSFEKGGLDIDYAYQWSMGKLETFSILVPNVYGTASVSPEFVSNSETKAKLLSLGVPPQQADAVAGQFAGWLYWGPQPGTSQVYFGVVVCFLFILSLFLIRSRHKWWLLAVTVIGIVMSWGRNFAGINDFLFYHLPFYNKFRAPSMSLILPQLTFVWLAGWALQELVTGNTDQKKAWEAIKKSLYITGGIIILLMIIPGSLMDYSGPNDSMLQGPQAQLLGALRSDRASLLQHDAFRSLILVLIFAALLWAFVKQKIKTTPFFVILGVVLLFDLFQVDKRFLNNDSFVPAEEPAMPAPSAADQQILQDKTPYYRTLNLATSPSNIFNGDALTSYYHKSVGGYSPAKLWRYQDLIDYQLTPEIQRIISSLQGKQSLDSAAMAAFQSSPVLNMLNTRYFIVNPGAPPVRNNAALGNAWFVKGVRWAPDANSEMRALSNLDVQDSAVIDQRLRSQVGTVAAADSAAHIQLTQYGLNALKYASENTAEGLAVFSDIYYPAGWKAFIDGKETPILRVNYALRGLKIPAGKHQIEFRFHPDTFFTGQKIAGFSSVLLILLVIGGLVAEGVRRQRAKV
ncbi:YfhO family protein [Compostibacter hankyongensis]|uniref:YfhO family protein n=1 Tax=Compostibacter hankyongensis TaxID=1007089 RepID=A0ABP8G659_9BACT